MDTISLWEAVSTRTANYPELTHDIEVDVAIIGGGITGITAASQLIHAGKKVAIIEAYQVGGITTGYSTGNLYVPVQPFYQNIISKFNFESTKIIAQSRKFAIDYIENNIVEKGISCNFSRRPWYGYTADHERISLNKEVDLLRKMDIPIEYTFDLPLPLKFKKAVTIPNQARFNPLQYVISMAENLAKKGCLIFENTRVLNIDEKDICTLKTAHGKIIANNVVVATHTPIGVNHTQLLTAPYRSYVVAARVKNNQYPEGHFVDLDRPPHSICTQPIKSNNPELILVAGSHHKTGQGENTHSHYEALRKFLRSHFSITDVPWQWSAQHYRSADNVPYIGLANKSSKHIYIATGYFADGLVYGTLAGIIIGDAIVKIDNTLSSTYQSNRFTPIASANFLVKENMNVFIQYLKDMPLFSIHNYSDIKAGEGRVVEVNQEKCGISRDYNGKLHLVSAVCSHMKGILNWNEAEQTWDCPCHGSRFSTQGSVIEGPAVTNLKYKQIKEET